MENRKFVLESGGIHLQFSPERGTLQSILLDNDPLKTEFCGNRENTSYKQIQELDQWTGDWRFRIWAGNHWQEELTSVSHDIRRVEMKNGCVTVSYEGQSQVSQGMRSLSLTERFSPVQSGFLWETVLTNQGEFPLEIGEVSLAWLANTDFTGIFSDPKWKGLEDWRGTKQKLWHEQRVQQHLSINGASSYAFLQRPSGDLPALLLQGDPSCGWEAAYQMSSTVGSQWSVVFEGPYYLTLYSAAARIEEKWNAAREQQRYWLNGNHSLLLQSGESRRFCFRITRVDTLEQLPEALYQNGQLSVEARPGYAVPAGQPITVRIRCKDTPALVPECSHAAIQSMDSPADGKESDTYYYSLSFSSCGQKKIRVDHGNTHTNLFFFSLPDTQTALWERASFISTQQFYDNPQDRFGRHHTFLPYDDTLQTLFLEGSETWQVGAMDEYALPVAMFLAEKNTIDPKPEEIQVLEQYIEESLFNRLQYRDTYLSRRGLYWEDRTPSDLYYGGKWSKEISESTTRSFNYPLISNIYFSMYRIASLYQMTSVRSADEYLDMLYHTVLRWFGTGHNRWNGAPAGDTIPDILEVFREKRPEWYAELNERVRLAAQENAESEYPYGSELEVDQTSHNQLYSMMQYYQYTEKEKEIFRITAALRSGHQPAWFLFGNDKRGNVCSWYGTAQNSRILYHGFQKYQNQDWLRLGYNGLASCLAPLRENGISHGWFTWWPDRTGFDSRSLDSDMALFAYLRTAASIVADDPEFGFCGYGCSLQSQDKIWTITPWDGIGRRFYGQPWKVSLELTVGSLTELCVDPEKKEIQIQAAPVQNRVSGTVVFQPEEQWKVFCNGVSIPFDRESACGIICL